MPQVRLAVRTDDEVGINTSLASRAKWKFVEILKEILLFQCTLKDLVERFLGSQNEVKQQAWHEKEHHQQRRKHLREYAAAPGLDITECPGYEREPQRNQVGDPDRQEKLCSARCGFDQCGLSLQHPAARSCGM